MVPSRLPSSPRLSRYQALMLDSQHSHASVATVQYPFLFPNEGVPAEDMDVGSGMSANLIRPAIIGYTTYRKFNFSLIFVDYPNEPDKDIYKRRVQLNRPSNSYMHTRYLRLIGSQNSRASVATYTPTASLFCSFTNVYRLKT